MDEGVNYSMPVAPAYNGGGFGGFGGDGWWVILLLILCGGWGGGFGGVGFDGLYPWMNNSQNINDGFRDQMLNSNLTGIQSSINGLSSQICSTQMADMERSFASQTANTQALTGISSQLATCCCDNRLATCQTQNIVATEGAATRLAIQEQTQAILDKMCQQEIDALKSQNLALQNQVNMQALAASQATQTAALIADNTAQTQYIVNRVAPYPIPAYTVANPVTPAL